MLVTHDSNVLSNATSVLEKALEGEREAEKRFSDARMRALEAQAVAEAAARELALRRQERALALAGLNAMRATLSGQPAERSQPAKRDWTKLWKAIPVAGLLAFCGFACWQLTPLNVHVCTTSMTNATAGALVQSFEKEHGTWPYHFTISQGVTGACDVRFFTSTNGYKAATIGHDALVPIVNPENPISQLQLQQIRSIFAGHGTGWTPLLPPDSSDDARNAIAFLGKAPGDNVMRSMSAADIVKFVASPEGKDAIALVPYSLAGSSKIVDIKGAPPPTPDSIANETYPLFVRMVAGSDFKEPPKTATQLLDYVRRKTT